MKLRTLTIRGLPESLLKVLRSAAKRSRRSLNAEVLVRLEAGAAAIAVESTAVGRPAPVGQSYEVRRAFDEANLSRLRSDLALTPEQRVRLAEEIARVEPSGRPRPRFQRVIQFERYEDYLDWKRFADVAP
jgi:plasmid stability protein